MVRLELDYAKHRTILLQILKDVYTDTSLSTALGFKGGTAAHLFYGLERNSVDLDFDLLDESREQEVFEKLQKITEKYGKVTSSQIKHYTLLNVISYQTGMPQIKVEVSRRHFDSNYEVKTLLGISMLVMIKEDMFAHKIMAMYERMERTSRDIFDVNFFYKKMWGINKNIVESRSGISFKELLETCVQKLEAEKYFLDLVNYSLNLRKIGQGRSSELIPYSCCGSLLIASEINY
jgi:predicted nucleotidyltransferase component of viral defense system